MSELYSRLFTLNPVLEEASRARRKFFRSAGQPGQVLFYIVMLFILLIYIWLLFISTEGGAPSVPFILVAQLTILTLALPITIYGAISGEREKSTWDALVLTRLTPGQIVTGKLLWRINTMLIIMGLFLPLVLAGVYGGAHAAVGGTFTHDGTRSVASLIVNTELMTFFWGFLLLAFGLFVSSRTSRSVASAAIAIITLLFTLVMCPALLNMVTSGFYFENFMAHPFPWFIIHCNPYLVSVTMANQLVGQNSYTPPSGFSYGAFQIVLYLILGIFFSFITYGGLKSSAGIAKN